MAPSQTIQTPYFSAFAHLTAVLSGLSVLYLVLLDPEWYLHSFVAKDHEPEDGLSEHIVWIILGSR